MLIGILFGAAADLFDPRLRLTLLKPLIGAAVLLVALWIGVGWGLVQTTAFESPWTETLVDILGGAAALVVTTMLYPAFASVGASLILDEVAAAVDPRPASRSGTSTAAAMALAVVFLAVSIGVNLLVLVALLIPPVFPFVFYGANGYLLGREYFEMAAMPRFDRHEVAALRRANRGRVFLLGIAIAFAHTLPVVNLAAPVFATIVMVRAVNAWRPRRGR